MFCALTVVEKMENFSTLPMGIMANNAPVPLSKRKGCAIDELLQSKRNTSSTLYRKMLESLVERKSEFLRAQKRASMFVDTRCVNELCVMNEFAELYQNVENISQTDSAKKTLLEDIVKESIIIEWPRTFPGVSSSGLDAEIDFAPLIHRARNVVKCRTSHPTMRVKVFALTHETINVEVLFRATLVKLASDNGDSRYRQVAGRMILTQREGIPVTKSQERSGAVVNADGKLTYHDNPSTNVLELMGEGPVKSTRLKFENGVLCATFPEMGVTLNSMIDRRQLSTRYAIQVEVGLIIDGKIELKHTIVSHPFLIAITNDQTEPLLQSIFWHRLVDFDHDNSIDILPEHSKLSWGILRHAIRAFIKCQLPTARFLTRYEILHIQCMVFLPRVMLCNSTDAIQITELTLFGNIQDADDASIRGEQKKIRQRLLTEFVMDYCSVDRKEFMTDKCLSLLDMCSELPHSTWQWLQRASEMVQDVGHKLCPTPVVDRKSTKTKKQMAAAEDYQTMLSLFNKGFITICSTHAVKQFLKSDRKSAMLMRFCDENCGHFSFCYGISKEKPIIGSISADRVKDFKQGLPEVLMDERYPSKFPELIRMPVNDDEDQQSTYVLKREIFHNYSTHRKDMESVSILDDETCRVDALSGAQLARATPPPSTSHQPNFEFSSLIGNDQIAQSLLQLFQANVESYRETVEPSCSTAASSQNDDEPEPTSIDKILRESMRTAETEEDPTKQIAQMLLNQYK
ncbi:unnamed protein product [Caenorhabditis bovis]|uniref:Uncharacterized protein n=1 Tax=Caenorhabditis bovis TaxID=2654633 RepID=A0A8S1ET83_9PELO|nr:unnamed protein product [Caenorhabditis bovis]